MYNLLDWEIGIWSIIKNQTYDNDNDNESQRNTKKYFFSKSKLGVLKITYSIL